MIIALAGRRVDAEDAPIRRFPQANETLVRERIRELLEQYRPSTVVASAAAGVDLLGLEEAGVHGIRRRIILPQPAERFRPTSVSDRGEDWGRRFDAVRAEIEPTGDLIVHPAPREDESEEDAYLRVVRAVLDESLTLARQELAEEGPTDDPPPSHVMAVVVWDGVSRGKNDMSAAFITEARARGIAIQRISTL